MGPSHNGTVFLLSEIVVEALIMDLLDMECGRSLYTKMSDRFVSRIEEKRLAVAGRMTQQ
jgi:hypothetical protein